MNKQFKLLLTLLLISVTVTSYYLGATLNATGEATGNVVANHVAIATLNGTDSDYVKYHAVESVRHTPFPALICILMVIALYSPEIKKSFKHT